MLIGNNILFVTLVLYPDTSPNLNNMVIIFGSDSEGFEKYSNRSSAYKDNLCSILLTIPLLSFAEHNNIARGSMVSANNNGDKRHPCLILNNGEEKSMSPYYLFALTL